MHFNILLMYLLTFINFQMNRTIRDFISTLKISFKNKKSYLKMIIKFSFLCLQLLIFILLSKIAKRANVKFFSKRAKILKVSHIISLLTLVKEKVGCVTLKRNENTDFLKMLYIYIYI